MSTRQAENELMDAAVRSKADLVNENAFGGAAAVLIEAAKSSFVGQDVRFVALSRLVTFMREQGCILNRLQQFGLPNDADLSSWDIEFTRPSEEFGGQGRDPYEAALDAVCVYLACASRASR
jgi:hypothetical protein